MGGALLSRKAGAGAHGYHVHLGAFLSPAGGLTWALALRGSGRPRASPALSCAPGSLLLGTGQKAQLNPQKLTGFWKDPVLALSLQKLKLEASEEGAPAERLHSLQRLEQRDRERGGNSLVPRSLFLWFPKDKKTTV